MRERLHAFLAQQGYPTDVVTEELVTPLDWERQGMAAGTPFALAHTFAQTGPFRPGNVERRLPGHVLRRLRHRARRRRTDGVDLGQAGRRAGRRTTCRGRRR